MHRRDFARFSAIGLGALAARGQSVAAQTPEGSPTPLPEDPWVFGSLPAWIDADERPGEWTLLFEEVSESGYRIYIFRNDTGSQQQVNMIAAELQDANGNVVGTGNDSFAVPYVVEPGALCLGLVNFGDSPSAEDPAIRTVGAPGVNEEFQYQNLRIVDVSVVEGEGVAGTVRNELPDPVGDVFALGIFFSDEDERIDFWFSVQGIQSGLDQGEETTFEPAYEFAAPAEHFVVAAVGRR